MMRASHAALLLALALAAPAPAGAEGILDSLGCIARAVYWEARDQPFDGQLGVAFVVLNRMRASGKTACAVVDGRGSFLAIAQHGHARERDARAWGLRRRRPSSPGRSPTPIPRVPPLTFTASTCGRRGRRPSPSRAASAGISSSARRAWLRQRLPQPRGRRLHGERKNDALPWTARQRHGMIRLALTVELRSRDGVRCFSCGSMDVCFIANRRIMGVQEQASQAPIFGQARRDFRGQRPRARQVVCR